MFTLAMLTQEHFDFLVSITKLKFTMAQTDTQLRALVKFF